MLLDLEQLFVFLDIDAIFLEECPFPLFDIAFMDFLKRPIPALHDEEVVSNEKIAISENNSDGLHYIP